MENRKRITIDVTELEYNLIKVCADEASTGLEHFAKYTLFDSLKSNPDQPKDLIAVIFPSEGIEKNKLQVMNELMDILPNDEKDKQKTAAGAIGGAIKSGFLEWKDSDTLICTRNYVA